MEETYNCTEQCESLDVSIDQNQLAYRLIKLRIRVLRANIGKLLCLCVPEREKWTEFGWDGKTVDDILDDLSKIDIPVYHPGDPEFQPTFLEHEKLNSEYLKNGHQGQKRKADDVKDALEQTQQNINFPSPLDMTATVVQESCQNQPNEMASAENAMIIDAEDLSKVYEKHAKEQ